MAQYRGHIASRITCRRQTRYEKVQGPLTTIWEAYITTITIKPRWRPQFGEKHLGDVVGNQILTLNHGNPFLFRVKVFQSSQCSWRWTVPMNFACGIPALSGMRKLNMTTSSDEQRSVTIANYWISHKRTFDEREGRSRDSCKCLILCHILFQFTETHISRIIFQYSNRGFARQPWTIAMQMFCIRKNIFFQRKKIYCSCHVKWLVIL